MARILLIAPTCDGHDVGEAWVAYQWAAGLSRRHDVTLLTYHKRGSVPASRQLSGLRVVEWQEPPLLGRQERLNSMLKPGYLPFYVRSRRWIRQALAAGERFDLVHQPVPVAMRYPSPAAGLGLRLVVGPVGGGLPDPPGFDEDDTSSPWFVGLRRFDSLRLRRDRLLRTTYADAACVLGIAPYVRAQLGAVPLRRFEVMSETALVALPTSEPHHPLRDGPVRLLFVGRLVATKGARLLIEAMARCADLDVRLDVVGDGPELQPCVDAVARHGLGERVVLHGRRDRTDVDAFYAKADVFTFPSYREPGGNVVFEAMGHRLPLIVCDRGGPGAAVDNACAVRIPVTTPEALV
ncbi:MAG: glycosyl transferase group 1, partial [Nocardioidaceae bacterium]|nr:glycosyl transferase group 1 [Nocardioidaceae bacterium]